MSHRAVSGQQFGEQLRMFMTPDELIDEAHKVDSQFYDFHGGSRRSPREQWEHPKSGVASVHSKEPFVRDRSLREEKLQQLQRPYRKEQFDQPYETMPPVELSHYGGMYADLPGADRPLLTQGHHRLAFAEARKIPYLAVTHHEYR